MVMNNSTTSKMLFNALKAMWICFSNNIITTMNAFTAIKLRQRLVQLSIQHLPRVYGVTGQHFFLTVTNLPAVSDVFNSVYIHQRNNLWHNKRRVMVMEVSLSNIMGCARVKCGLLQGG